MSTTTCFVHGAPTFQSVITITKNALLQLAKIFPTWPSPLFMVKPMQTKVTCSLGSLLTGRQVTQKRFMGQCVAAMLQGWAKGTANQMSQIRNFMTTRG